MEEQVYFGVSDSVMQRMRTPVEGYYLHVQALSFLDLDAEHFLTAHYGVGFKTCVPLGPFLTGHAHGSFIFFHCSNLAKCWSFG